MKPGKRDQEDFEAEIRSHLEMEADRLRALGVADTEVESRARRNFGNVGAAHDRFHDAQRWAWARELGADFRFAARTLRRARGYSAAVVLTLALAIGANAGVFTIVDSVLLRPLPYPESDRIVSLSRSEDGVDGHVLDDATFRALAAGGARSLESVAASFGLESIVNTPSGPMRVDGAQVTPKYFDVYGYKPFRGRTFTNDETEKGGAAVVVLSEQLWRERFGADAAILGKSIVIDDRPYSVIGVMPAAITTAKRNQFWTPRDVAPRRPGSMFFYTVVGRMRAGARIETVRAEVSAVVKRVQSEASAPFRDRRAIGAVVMTLHERRFGDSRKALVLLWITAGLLLLVACANLANLSLARAAKRGREFALRLILGAGRGRIARFVLCECLILSAAGGGLGVALAAASVGTFARIAPGSVANLERVHVDGMALAFTFGIIVATAMLFGLVPALRAANGDTRAIGSARLAGSRRERGLRAALIVGQLATALVLMTCAALVTKTLIHVTAIDVGFDPDQLVAIRPTLAMSRYTDARAGVFYDQLVARLRHDPMVSEVALVNAPPLGGVRESFSLVDPVSGDGTKVDVAAGDPDYLRTIGGRMVEGRWFNANDKPGATNVAVINEAFARARWPGVSPIGERINLDGEKTVVGVVHDIRQRGLEEAPTAEAFLSLAQFGVDPYETVVVRTASGLANVRASVRDLVRSLDAAQPEPEVETMESRVADAVAPQRFVVILLALFAGLAALLAVVGLYGVLSYLVAERTREIGIRMALGADRARTVRLVLGSGAVWTAVGILIGAGAAAGAVRLMRGMMYDLSVYDPWMFGASAGLLAAAALVAAYIPARHASGIDPVSALKAE